ncbi:amidohydrolase family protein [Nocardioides nitrophenolicus]|uniref:amidohydrolase family protein n=1 Tax=Nocardioides nitrophenolicus TaxID=60489 RepID=UPI0019597CC0|nr:amidohydrolase family protein [Nocardioides nitrophenolicus]MBM7518522.1 aminocarboxymuconate-semialdehyde decarboxylase [Nocardioides nitrophenolicus]
MGTIDVHTHSVPRGWPDLGAGFPWLRVDSEREAVIMVGSREFRRVQSDCWDAEVRLRDMDADGVDIQVVSPTPVFFGYDAPAGEAERISRVFNDLALEVCAPAGDRLIPFCQVPLQDTDAACRELERAVAAGHRGVEIGNHVGDRDLDDAGIVTFLQHAAALDVPVFVHPWDLPGSPRLNRWMAQWLTGMPAETHLSILAMILGGTFDQVPDSLRICFAHGGGSFAFWLGRVENAWHRRSDIIATSEQPPSAYVGRFSVDSVVFEPAALRLLVDTLGAEQVMVGSDYPYPLGERPVADVVRRADFLDDAARELILRGNALRFLGEAGARA